MTLVKVSDHDRVRVLTLDRPEARNALSAALRQQLIAALKTAAEDDGIGAIVLTGAGKCFAAGADLRELEARSTEEQRAFLQPPHIYSVIQELAKPVLAAINGHALGAGLELATACDYRVAHPDAKLGQPEINLGLIPGGGGTQRLPALVGPGHAARLVLTGDAIRATEAQVIGLIEEVRDDPVARCIELGHAMARHERAALAAAKRCLRTAPEGLAKEIDAFVDLHAREETKRRIRAFLEG